MSGFSILMLIFAVLIFLAGLYIYTGHNNELLLWKGYKKNRSKEELKLIGKWTMISSSIPFILSIIGLFINEQ